MDEEDRMTELALLAYELLDDWYAVEVGHTTDIPSLMAEYAERHGRIRQLSGVDPV